MLKWSFPMAWLMSALIDWPRAIKDIASPAATATWTMAAVNPALLPQCVADAHTGFRWT